MKRGSKEWWASIELEYADKLKKDARFKGYKSRLEASRYFGEVFDAVRANVFLCKLTGQFVVTRLDNVPKSTEEEPRQYIKSPSFKGVSLV